MQMRIAVLDFVTNTCFPLLAAEELGFFKAEGLDAQVELITLRLKPFPRYVKAPPTPMRVVPSMLSSSLFPAGKGSSLLLHSLKGFPGF